MIITMVTLVTLVTLVTPAQQDMIPLFGQDMILEAEWAENETDKTWFLAGRPNKNHVLSQPRLARQKEIMSCLSSAGPRKNHVLSPESRISGFWLDFGPGFEGKWPDFWPDFEKVTQVSGKVHFHNRKLCNCMIFWKFWNLMKLKEIEGNSRKFLTLGQYLAISYELGPGAFDFLGAFDSF